MDKYLFYTWLKGFKKLDTTIVSVRTSNCIKIEEFYGDLDNQYSYDRCTSLLKQFDYTIKDKNRANTPKHKIPITGDVYDDTHTLQVALELYVEFKTNQIIEELKVTVDIEPDTHDGSYELLRETVMSLATIPKDQLGISDLDLLYLMVIGTWRSDVEDKRHKINASHLNEYEKDRLSSVLDRIKEKARQHNYKNIDQDSEIGWSIGMFDTELHTFTSKADKESAQSFISLCVELKSIEDEEEMFQKVQETINKGIKGIDCADASVILHCLKPYTFPIMNSAVSETQTLFQIEGVLLEKPKELNYYIQNVRKLKKFRDEKFVFRNYRAMDLKLSEYGGAQIENAQLPIKKLYSKEEFLKEVFMSEERYDEIRLVLGQKKNIILQGAPGVGKTFAAKKLAHSIMECIDDSRVEMVQFHQNYSYEDFVMGFRPVEDGGFKLRNGVFHQFCIKASKDLTKEYFFIIDEINRGNLSKIFGELLMLIENDKRGPEFAVPLTYNMDIRFHVPENVYIIGMMNTADRSLAMIDYALRRRFSFIEIEPAFGNPSFRKHLSDRVIASDLIEKIISKFTDLNKDIELDGNLGKGFRIGHSYFCKPSTDKLWYESVINYEIKPLIEEYWFDNEEKARKETEKLLE